MLEEAVYGLPELNRERIRARARGGQPGLLCRRRCSWASCRWSRRASSISTHLIADAKSGVSGAGRKAEVHILFSEAADNFGYALPGIGTCRRSWRDLAQAAGREVGLTFVPHLMPMIRGIHATLYARLTQEVDVQALYEKRYAKEPFVDVMPAGSTPDTRSVRGANQCRIALHRPGDGDTVVVLVGHRQPGERAPRDRRCRT